jgi:hypothetical protein
MAMPATIPDEVAYAGDGYALVHIAEDRPYDSAETWAAQVRKQKSDPVPVVTFVVTARAGTADDDLTGLDETGNTIVVTSLTGAQTRSLIGDSYCDLEVRPVSGDPITFLAWKLHVERDVTR